MDAIMIDSSDEAAETCDEDEPKPKNQHEKRDLIVYTTKLDDMKIFKEDISDMDVDTIISSIIKESKPKFNWKRKYSETTHSRCSNEHLSSHLNNFNRKVARTAEDNKYHYPVCKPVKVVLEDIKHTLLRSQTTDSNLKTVKITSPYVNTKSAIGMSRKLKINLIYDQQNKEADMYYLDKNLLVKEHNTYRIDGSNDHIFRELKLNKIVSEVSCCCWYEREQYLTNNMLGLIPHGTLRFMRKPHKCAINLCRCCCRNQSIYVSNDTSAIRPRLLRPSESPSIWFNKMTELNASLSSKSSGSLRSKPLRVVPKLTKNIYPVKPSPEHEMPYFLHSTGIDFGEEYYAIGADGKIKLSLKDTGKDPQQLANLKSKTTNNIVGNICCWFRREEFADRLLLHGALRNTVNYIRTAHTCPTTNCICCCKPSNTKKFQLPRIHKIARHTNDLVSKKVNIKVRFTGVVEEPVAGPLSVKAARKYTTKNKNKNKIISFNVSLSALETISKSNGSEDMCKDVFDSIIPEAAILDQNKRSVRVLIEKTAKKENVVIECKTHLNDFTTSELTLLDIIFRAVNNNTLQTVAPAPQKNNHLLKRTRIHNVYGHTYSPIYPLLLNTQLSITSDLRNKRFMPPLRAHLVKYNLPEMVNNISLWMAEAKQKELSTNLAESQPKVDKAKRIVYGNKIKRHK